MILEDYTELSSYLDALIAQVMDATGEEDTDMNGHFSWAMIGEALESMGEPSDQATAPAAPAAPPALQVSSVDALLCIADSAASILQQGKISDPTVAEMVADMMRDTAEKIGQDPALPIAAKEQQLMVLWLQRYADKLAQLSAPQGAAKSAQGLWNNIQYKVRQFHDMLA